ncbi:DUF6349 family protein, partial [Streptomyces sp. NPDC018019]|uniref:DUF6349 family protein n=1 Tax=Streptomyces sp. NPDC018019 TaxID=3365030 RepID=UPI0037B3D3A9
TPRPRRHATELVGMFNAGVVPATWASGMPLNKWALARSERLWRHISVRYPPGWTGAGAPLLVRARYRKEPHDPPYKVRPRYELRVSQEEQQATSAPTEQKTLF